jgi:hypothetical protein
MLLKDIVDLIEPHRELDRGAGADRARMSELREARARKNDTGERQLRRCRAAERPGKQGGRHQGFFHSRRPRRSVRSQ